MVKVTVLVEGAGESNALKSEAKRQLGILLGKLRLTRKPEIEFHGSRRAAFERFRIETNRGPEGRLFLLLVDSEDPVNSPTDQGTKYPYWEHLRIRDSWSRPQIATDEHLYFMATAMETWIIADRDSIKSRFPRDYRDGVISDHQDWERLPKDRVQELLRKATGERIGSGRYEKGKISFELLGKIDPAVLRKSCPHADRFFKALEQHLG